MENSQAYKFLPSAKQFAKDIGVKNLKGEIPEDYVGRWVEVSEALPPERKGVIVAGDIPDSPMFAYLRYAAGDIYSPYFVCPAMAGTTARGVGDVTSIVAWFSPTPHGLPLVYPYLKDDIPVIGLSGNGWVNTQESDGLTIENSESVLASLSIGLDTVIFQKLCEQAGEALTATMNTPLNISDEEFEKWVHEDSKSIDEEMRTHQTSSYCGLCGATIKGIVSGCSNSKCPFIK